MQQIYLALMLFYTFQVEERMDIDKFSAHGEVHAHFQAEQKLKRARCAMLRNLKPARKIFKKVGLWSCLAKLKKRRYRRFFYASMNVD